MKGRYRPFWDPLSLIMLAILLLYGTVLLMGYARLDRGMLLFVFVGISIALAINEFRRFLYSGTKG